MLDQIDPALDTDHIPGADDLSPVFIVGCQRSGSTLVGAMMGAADGAIAIPEAQFVADLAPANPDTLRPLSAWCATINAHPRFRIWDWSMPAAPDDPVTFAGAIRWLVATYARSKGQPTPRVWIDHQPGHVRWLARLRLHFPSLRVIHLVRDGRAVAASIMPLDWGPNTINRAAFFWQQRLALGFAATRSFPNDAAVTIRYEDVLENAPAALAPALRNSGLKWRDTMLAGGVFVPPAFTRAQHRLVGTPPRRDRATGWHAALDAREIEIFEALNGDLLTYLGYQPVSGPRPRPPGRLESLILNMRHALREFVNSQRFKGRMQRAVKGT